MAVAMAVAVAGSGGGGCFDLVGRRRKLLTAEKMTVDC